MGSPVESRYLGLADREAALSYLGRDSVANLLLIDLAAKLGSPPEPGESRAEVVAAWCDGEIVGMVALRPSVVLDANADAAAIEAFLPYLESLSVGLVKSEARIVGELWDNLVRRRDRRAIVDRVEIAHSLRPGNACAARASTRFGDPLAVGCLCRADR